MRFVTILSMLFIYLKIEGLWNLLCLFLSFHFVFNNLNGIYFDVVNNCLNNSTLYLTNINLFIPKAIFRLGGPAGGGG